MRLQDFAFEVAKTTQRVGVYLQTGILRHHKSVPVSYTHLDVYKRQRLYVGLHFQSFVQNQGAARLDKRGVCLLYTSRCV